MKDPPEAPRPPAVRHRPPGRRSGYHERGETVPGVAPRTHAQEHATVLIVRCAAARPGDEFRREPGRVQGIEGWLLSQIWSLACRFSMRTWWVSIHRLKATRGRAGFLIECQVHDDLLCFMPVEIIMNLWSTAQRLKICGSLSDHSASRLSESSGEKVSSDWCSLIARAQPRPQFESPSRACQSAR